MSPTGLCAILKEKIRAISYGIFIPTFFVLVGASTDIGVFSDFSNAGYLAIIIIIGSITAKFLSGWIGGKTSGFTGNQSLLFAVSSIPQLSTTLAVAFTSLTLDIIDQELMTAMIVLSIVTVIVSPTLINLFTKRIKNSLDEKTGPTPETTTSPSSTSE